MNRTIYISGPIKGKPDGNRAAFASAAQELSSAGYTPLNPHDIEPFPRYAPSILPVFPASLVPPTHADFMRTDLIGMLAADVIGLAYLPGWEISKGALLEIQVAVACGIEVKALQEWTS